MSLLFIGSVISVQSRQLKLVEYADVSTRKFFEMRKSSSIVVVKPEGYERIGEVIQSILDNDLTIHRAELMRLDFPVAAAYLDASGRQVTDSAVGALAGEVVLCLDVQGQDCIAAVQRTFGAQHPFVLASGDSARAAKETAVLFDRPRATTAVFNNCSCLLVKPHAMNKLGDIITQVLSAGFEISALKTFHLDGAASREFFEVYRSVLPEYKAITEHVSAGQVCAMEVRQQDVVPALRELAGPYDPEVAKALRPQTLRARWGLDRARNCVHVTDLPEDGLLEVEYFFKILFADGAGEQVAHPNSTLNQTHAGTVLSR